MRKSIGVAPTFMLEVPGQSSRPKMPPGDLEQRDLGPGDELLLPEDIDELPESDQLSDEDYDQYDYSYDEDGLDETRDEEESGLFGAAYEQMVFRDSTDDGVEGEISMRGLPTIRNIWNGNMKHSDWSNGLIS